MPRPRKQGMDYFPHDTDAASDPKLAAMIAVHGLPGYAFYFMLLERIYREDPPELDVKNQLRRKVLAKSLNLFQKRFDRMLETALEYGCFDATAYEERGVITSTGIQARAASVQAERERKRGAYKSAVSARRNSGETPEKLRNTPRKGKEREVKDNYKGNDSLSAAPPPAEEADYNFDSPAPIEPQRLIPLPDAETPDPPTSRPNKPSKAANASVEDQLASLTANLPPADITLIDAFLELAAAENKSGSITASRRVNETRALCELQQEIGTDAWRYGMEAAIRAEAPNINYVKKAARSWNKTTDTVGGFVGPGELARPAAEYLGRTADDDPTNPGEAVYADAPQWLKDKVVKDDQHGE